MRRAAANFFPCPLGRGQKVKYHQISITKSISKIFKPNFVCLLTNKRYKKYQTRFSFSRLGHAPGVVRLGDSVCVCGGGGGGVAVKNLICPKFNQIWCVSYSHEWGMQQTFFGPVLWGPGKGSKGQISLNFNYKDF